MITYYSSKSLFSAWIFPLNVYIVDIFVAGTLNFMNSTHFTEVERVFLGIFLFGFWCFSDGLVSNASISFLLGG